jgi:hypothetical protein
MPAAAKIGRATKMQRKCKITGDKIAGATGCGERG